MSHSFVDDLIGICWNMRVHISILPAYENTQHLKRDTEKSKYKPNGVSIVV